MQQSKLPYDTSNEKAKELQLSDFGLLDEVMEQAKPLRFAANRREASEILKMIAQQGPLTLKRTTKGLKPDGICLRYCYRTTIQSMQNQE